MRASRRSSSNPALRAGLHAAALLALSAAASRAAAQAPPPAESADDRRARVHFESATEYFEAADYESAAREFRSAYALSGRPQLLYNLYLAHERLGQVTEAADYLERFLAAVPDAENRATLERRLRTMRERLARDAEAAERARAASDASATPRAPPEPSEPAPPRGVGSSPLFWAGVVTAGVGALSYGVFGALVLVEDARLARACGRDAGRTCSEDDVGALRGFALGADVGLAVLVAGGAVAGIAALIAGMESSVSGGAQRGRPVARGDRGRGVRLSTPALALGPASAVALLGGSF